MADMQIDIVTIFPEMFSGPFSESILGKAVKKGLLVLNVVNLRDFSGNKHRKVDDYPYGGGAGMVMKPEPFFDAVDFLRKNAKQGEPHVILMSPQGKTYSQSVAQRLAQEKHLVLLCGHYEGVDERVRQYLVHEELSIGDYVLTGGELPAMVVVDSVARLLPGVLGDEHSAREDSFSTGLLEYPQYTRPREYRGLKVPEVLLSGNHGLVAKWRRQQSLKRTLQRRPDLLRSIELSQEDQRLLKASDLTKEAD